MKNTEDRYAKLGIGIPKILLPAENIDLSSWAVVACDQFTSQPEYWKKVEDLTKGTPSSYHLVLPEIYLEYEDKAQRIARIEDSMKSYLDGGILKEEEPGFILTDRKTPHAPSRKGLIMAVDLEKYDYAPGSQSLIRATEGTVLERLPPRISIRENAPLELPHIMLLIDDPEKTVIEPVADAAAKLEKLYDFELMLGGGHITAYKVKGAELLQRIAAALEMLADPGSFAKRYQVGKDKGVLLFAVGDGNHSLAAAKALWEKLKNGLSRQQAENHPARYALAEVVNVHDEGLRFEPIHRVLFNVDAKAVLEDFRSYYRSRGRDVTILEGENRNGAAPEEPGRKEAGAHYIPFICANSSGCIKVSDPLSNLEAGTLQAYIDYLLKSSGTVKVDYIHGGDVAANLGSKPGNMGFLLPPTDKRDLFRTVIIDGVLPRKTFSMGEAEEKRYYLECRKIK